MEKKHQINERVEVLTAIGWEPAVVTATRSPFDGSYCCLYAGHLVWFPAVGVRALASAPSALTEAAAEVVRERNAAVERAMELEAELNKALEIARKYREERDADTVKIDSLERSREHMAKNAEASECYRKRQDKDLAELRAKVSEQENTIALSKSALAAQEKLLEETRANEKKLATELARLRSCLWSDNDDRRLRPIQLTDITIDQQFDPMGRGVDHSWIRFDGHRTPRLIDGALGYRAYAAGEERVAVYFHYNDHFLKMMRDLFGEIAPKANDPDYTDDEKQLEHYLADKRSGTTTHVPVSRANLKRWLESLKSQRKRLDDVARRLRQVAGLRDDSSVELALTLIDDKFANSIRLKHEAAATLSSVEERLKGAIDDIRKWEQGK